MRAEKLGEHLLMQVATIWNEHVLDHSEVSFGVFWLALLLRGRHLSDQDVDLPVGVVSLEEVANAIQKLSFLNVPEGWKDYPSRGINALRAIRDTSLDLTRSIEPRQRFPEPLEVSSYP